MPDGWEAGWGFNPLDPADAAGDHVSNLRECQIGTPPAGTFRVEEHAAALGDWAPLLPRDDGSLLLVNDSAFLNAVPQTGVDGQHTPSGNSARSRASLAEMSGYATDWAGTSTTGWAEAWCLSHSAVSDGP